MGTAEQPDSRLSSRARTEIHNIVTTDMAGSIESRHGIYLWAGEVKEVISSPSWKRKAIGHFRLFISAVDFLFDGVAPSRIFQIYNIARGDKNINPPAQP
jgi:hypothetical protein